jgi:hypothetical protein
MGQCIGRIDKPYYYDIGEHRHSIPSYQWSHSELEQIQKTKKPKTEIEKALIHTDKVDNAKLILGYGDLWQLRIYCNSKRGMSYLFLNKQTPGKACHGELDSQVYYSADMILRCQQLLESKTQKHSRSSWYAVFPPSTNKINLWSRCESPPRDMDRIVIEHISVLQTFCARFI